MEHLERNLIDGDFFYKILIHQRVNSKTFFIKARYIITTENRVAVIEQLLHPFLCGVNTHQQVHCVVLTFPVRAVNDPTECLTQITSTHLLTAKFHILYFFWNCHHFIFYKKSSYYRKRNLNCRK